jgi:predicted DNA binding CopG/RHH family protein
MKNKSISLRLNDDNKEFLKQQAKAHNLSLSRYVREVVTNTYKNE